MTELVAPTNGALVAALVAAGVPFDRWLRFEIPILALGAPAIGIGLQ